MRVLIIAFPSQDNCIGGEDQIAKVLLPEFENLGHKVSICNRNNYNQIDQYDYDFIFSLNHPIKIIQKKEIIWATWLFNENLGTDINDIKNSNYDVFFVNSHSVNEKLKNNKLNSIFVPFPSFDYYDRVFPLINPEDKKIDIIYLGNYNPEYKSIDKINDYLIPCLEYDFYIYGGNKWLLEEQKKLFDKGIFNPEYFCKIYESYYKGIFPIDKCKNISDYAKIFINFNSPDQLKLGMINNRIFDLLNNGCFIITDDCKSQREEFGDCVEYSTGKEDLKEKIKYYLSNPKCILEKQKKALEYSVNRKSIVTYSNTAKAIVEYISSNSSYIIEKRKSMFLLFDIIVNNVELLDSCIKSISNQKFDKIKYKFHVLGSNRIHATKVIKNNLENNFEIVIIDKDPYEYRVLYSEIDLEDVIIPSYSNVIYPRNFCKDLYDKFYNNEDIDIISYPLIDCSCYQKKVFGVMGDDFCFDNNANHFLPYGFYSLRYSNKLFHKYKYLNWNDISENNLINSIELCPNILFETKDQKSKFIKNNYQEIIGSLLSKKEDDKNKDITCFKRIDTQSIRFSILSLKEIDSDYTNLENIIIKDQNIEDIIRTLESHYTLLCLNDINFNLQDIANIVLCHMNYDVFIIESCVLIKTSLLYQCNIVGTLSDIINNIISDKAYSFISINANTYDIEVINDDKNFIIKKENGLKVAVLSMCGVSSYEDKYGIGGEHQVVHWLKKSFEQRYDVEFCNIFDTYNYDLMDTNEYDIIFSNSCWRDVRKRKKDTLSIFWHFNMDSGRATMDTVQRLNYDWVWTNSYVGYDWLKNKNINCMLKQLNASSQYHYPYPYKSSLYHHDVTYVGGYQVHYKGKELIDKFVKPCCKNDFDFAIYGNRLWKIETQKHALSTDSYFKDEYYDESFEPYYKKILPMQDFNILAKNTKIWINFNAMTQRYMQMNNDRVIWGLACGAFFITDDTKEARKFYQDSNPEECPVVFSSGGDDLLKKIYYYLEHEEERKDISSRGLNFVKKNKLYTDDTVDKIINLYYNRENHE